MKKILVIFLFIATFVLVLLPMNRTIALASDNEDEGDEIDVNTTLLYDVNIENQIVNYNSEIHIVFELNNDLASTAVSLINTTFTPLNRIVELDETIDVYVTNNHQAGEYSFEIDVQVENGISFTQPIYIYSDGVRDCVSSSCIEEAKDIYFCNFVATQEELILLGKIDEPENYDYTAYHYTVISEYTELTV